VSDRPQPRDVVAVVLAISLGTAVNLLMFAVLWDALRSDTPGLSENATQVIIAAFGGIVGILGGYLGARAVERAHDRQTATPAQTSPDAPGSPLPGDPPPNAEM
jgi:sulfite exporter TauE/SafE